VAAVQGLQLTALASTTVTSGSRQYSADGQGHIRQAIWTSPLGLVTEIALYDENERILRLDRWRNQTVVPDSKLPILHCGPSVDRKLLLRPFNHGAFGNLDLETKIAETIADLVTNHGPVHDAGLPLTASSPVTTSTEVVGGTEAASLSPVGAKAGGSSFSLDKPLIVAPNPISDKATAYYQLSVSSKVRVSIFDLTGALLRTYDQGQQDPGIYQLPMDVHGYANGVYLATLVVDEGGGEKPLSIFKFAVKR
jgi:hypothetical protein